MDATKIKDMLNVLVDEYSKVSFSSCPNGPLNETDSV